MLVTWKYLLDEANAELVTLKKRVKQMKLAIEIMENKVARQEPFPVQFEIKGTTDADTSITSS